MINFFKMNEDYFHILEKQTKTSKGHEVLDNYNETRPYGMLLNIDSVSYFVPLTHNLRLDRHSFLESVSYPVPSFETQNRANAGLDFQHVVPINEQESDINFTLANSLVANDQKKIIARDEEKITEKLSHYIQTYKTYSTISDEEEKIQFAKANGYDPKVFNITTLTYFHKELGLAALTQNLEAEQTTDNSPQVNKKGENFEQSAPAPSVSRDFQKEDLIELLGFKTSDFTAESILQNAHRVSDYLSDLGAESPYAAATINHLFAYASQTLNIEKSVLEQAYLTQIPLSDEFVKTVQPLRDVRLFDQLEDITPQEKPVIPEQETFRSVDPLETIKFQTIKLSKEYEDGVALNSTFIEFKLKGDPLTDDGELLLQGEILNSKEQPLIDVSFTMRAPTVGVWQNWWNWNSRGVEDVIFENKEVGSLLEEVGGQKKEVNQTSAPNAELSAEQQVWKENYLKAFHENKITTMPHINEPARKAYDAAWKQFREERSKERAVSTEQESKLSLDSHNLTSEEKTIYERFKEVNPTAADIVDYERRTIAGIFNPQPRLADLTEDNIRNYILNSNLSTEKKNEVLADLSFIETKEQQKIDLAAVELVRKKDIEGLSKHMKEGMKNYLNSEQYKNYLNFVSSFHQYSSHNIQLILAQKPDARIVAGAGKWKKDYGRFPAKGSKALWIYSAPQTYTLKDENGKPLIDKEGNERTRMYWKLIPVFDVSQTTGKELPERMEAPQEKVNHYQNLFCAISDSIKAPISFEELPEGTYGYYQPSRDEIVLQSGMYEAQTIAVLIHEATHSELHTNSQAKYGDKTYRKQEFEAESTAYVVSQHYGIDTTNYSFGYLNAWGMNEKDLSELKEVMTNVQKESHALIEKIDQALEKYVEKSTPEVSEIQPIATEKTSIVSTSTPAKEVESQEKKGLSY